MLPGLRRCIHVDVATLIQCDRLAEWRIEGDGAAGRYDTARPSHCREHADRLIAKMRARYGGTYHAVEGTKEG
jgi:hypothetical protein